MVDTGSHFTSLEPCQVGCSVFRSALNSEEKKRKRESWGPSFVFCNDFTP